MEGGFLVGVGKMILTKCGVKNMGWYPGEF